MEVGWCDNGSHISDTDRRETRSHSHQWFSVRFLPHDTLALVLVQIQTFSLTSFVASGWVELTLLALAS